MRWLKHQRGFTLMETMIALGILGFIGVGFMLGLSTVFRVQGITKEQVRAENLARGQLEYIRFVNYKLNYTTDCVPDCVPPPGLFIPPGYSIAVTTTQYCDATPTCYDVNQIQKNTVSISRDGNPLLFVEDLKTKK